MSGWLIHRLCRVESQLCFFQFCCWHSSTVVVMAGCDMNRSSWGGDVCIHCLVVSLRRRYRLNNDWFHTECPRCDSQLDNLTRYNYCQHKYGFKCYSRITWFCEVCIKCGEAFHLRDLSRIACYTCSWDNIKFAVLDDRSVSNHIPTLLWFSNEKFPWPMMVRVCTFVILVPMPWDWKQLWIRGQILGKHSYL